MATTQELREQLKSMSDVELATVTAVTERFAPAVTAEAMSLWKGGE